MCTDALLRSSSRSLAVTTSPRTSPSSSPTSSPSARFHHPHRLPRRHPHPLVRFKRESRRADARLPCLRLQQLLHVEWNIAALLKYGILCHIISLVRNSNVALVAQTHPRRPPSSTRTMHCPYTYASSTKRTPLVSEEDPRINELVEFIKTQQRLPQSSEYETVHRLTLQDRHGCLHCQQ